MTRMKKTGVRTLIVALVAPVVLLFGARSARAQQTAPAAAPERSPRLALAVLFVVVLAASFAASYAVVRWLL